MNNGPGLPDHNSTRRYWRLNGRSELPGGGTGLRVIPFSVEITRIAPKDFTTERNSGWSLSRAYDAGSRGYAPQ